MGWPHLYWLLAAAALSFLAYASYLDVRYREVEPAYWYAALRILAPLGALMVYESLRAPIPHRVVVAQLAADAAAVAAALATYLAGLLGGGDLLAVALIAAATPLGDSSLLPPALLALLYGSLASLAHVIRFCLVNVARHRARLAELARRRGLWRALAACFTSTPMRVGEALARGWLYPASWEVGPYRLVEEDPPALLAQVASERGYDAWVWVTPGLPEVLYIALGYLAALLVGDQPIRILMAPHAG